jgi:Uma2 family endonuclease
MTITDTDLDQLIHDRAIRLMLLGPQQRPIWEASPSPLHQMVVRTIERSIEPVPNDGGGCACYSLADTYFRLPDGSLVRPDIAILCRVPKRQREALTVVPAAVIEVVSPGYQAKDYDELPPIYLANGIPDVLVVDIERGTLTHITPEDRQEMPLPAVRLLSSGCRCLIPE